MERVADATRPVDGRYVGHVVLRCSTAPNGIGRRALAFIHICFWWDLALKCSGCPEPASGDETRCSKVAEISSGGSGHG